jgi:NADH-quinone oxidoreductase subunit N
VAGFLSVASKGAAFALMVRLALALVGSAPPVGVQPIFAYLGLAVSAIAVATTTFGNLAAYSQDNLKRLLAYSTIAHAGFMLMAIGAMLVVLSGPPPGSAISNEASLATAVRCVEGLLFYLWVYLFTNLGAFAVVALIRNEIFSEDLKDYAGLGAQIPGLGVCLGVCLFSLVGLPPLGGFWGKFVIAYAVFEAGAYHWVMYAVLVLAVANTVFSLFYYVRVLKRMFLDKAESAPRTVRVPLMSVTGTFCAGLAALVFLTGTFLVEPLTRTAREVAEILFL